MAQFLDERRGHLAGFVGTGQQDLVELGGVVDQFLVLFAHRCDFAVDALEQHLLGVAPGDAFGVGFGQGGRFFGAGKGLVDLEQGRALCALGFAGGFGVGDDAGDLLAHLCSRCKQRDGVVVALAHLAAIQPGQEGDRFFDHRFGQHKVFAIQVVEAGGHVACHLDVLDLVATHRHFVRFEHQDVGAHEHGVHEQAGGHIAVGVVACGVVFVDGSFVGVGAVEHAFAGHAGQEPGQLRDFRDIGLAVKGDFVCVQARGDPAGGNLQR